ncbi:MAG TPA: LacI family DNA-binding transcriptional regulator [Candidatus Nanopelagicaceae bacterium]|nr:LacI family DNA-binding transcriptional regulator [Candidatus Nanopelagicaceae bacterium]
MTSLRDVAKHAGVSIATASRVVNQPDAVRPETREAVQRAMTELLFVLRDPVRQEKLAGLFVPDLLNPIFTHITQQIENKARERGWSIALCTTGDSASVEREHAQEFFTRQITKLIFISSVAANTAEHLPHYRALIENGAKLLFVNGAPDDLQAPAVSDDERHAGRIAAQHLLELGHRQLGFITGNETSSTRSPLRLAGIREVLSEYSDAKVQVVHSTWGVEGGVAGAETLLRANPEITAVICASDLTALGVMNFCSHEGISVPSQLSVLGSDGIDLGRWFTPALSTIQQPLQSIAETVASWLEDDDSSQFRHSTGSELLFRPTLLSRETTAFPR